MKRIIYATILFAMILGFNAKAQNSLYNKYNDMPNVTSVYISKAMLSMSPRVINQDVIITKVANQLDAIYIISTFDQKIMKEMKKDIKNLIDKGKYELLMKQKGIASSSAFYIKKKGDKITDLIMITEGAKEKYTHLIGEMSFDDIRRITLINGQSYNTYSMGHFDKREILKNFKGLKELEKLKNLKGLKDIEKLKDMDFSSLKKLDTIYGID
ncbi:DUF4252 domain-containing protein [uncultured Bacteroides sp.]|uniref:DUF4252 domain-containing protein n=1 Tax=uncultured Bacteroides sp. TaxID=162156 RepID=UPI002AABB483|nr:DUF4252 domain-containing protein [uncultured Bacteroides sp.]